MELLVSVSAPRLTAALLEKNKTGSYHGGAQHVSNINGSDILWNYLGIVGGKTQVVLTKKEAVGIVAQGKLYKF